MQQLFKQKQSSETLCWPLKLSSVRKFCLLPETGQTQTTKQTTLQPERPFSNNFECPQARGEGLQPPSITSKLLLRGPKNRRRRCTARQTWTHQSRMPQRINAQVVVPTKFTCCSDIADLTFMFSEELCLFGLTDESKRATENTTSRGLPRAS